MGAQNWPQYRNPNDTINPITRRRPCYDATCCSVPHYCVVAVLDGEKGPSDGGFSLSNARSGPECDLQHTRDRVDMHF